MSPQLAFLLFTSQYSKEAIRRMDIQNLILNAKEEQVGSLEVPTTEGGCDHTAISSLNVKSSRSGGLRLVRPWFVGKVDFQNSGLVAS